MAVSPLMNDPMLAVPLKRMDPLDWVKPLKAFIKETVNEHEAECSAEALEKMSRLRKAVKEVAEGKESVSEHAIEQVFYPYLALLEHACAHFPLKDGRVRVSFCWYDVAFRKKVALPSVTWEQSCVLFNAAAAYMFLGTSEDRSSADGIKNSFKHFQAAAGVLECVRARVSTLSERLTVDLCTDGLAMFIALAMASAHHCSYLKARNEMKDKHAVLSKLSMEASLLYDGVAKLMAHPTLAEITHRRWIGHCEFSRQLMEARANIHLAEDFLKQDELGIAVARLQRAVVLLGEADKTSRELGAAYTQLLSSVTPGVRRQLDAAVLDNDRIYHCRVPKLDALEPPPRLGKALAKATPLAGLLELSTVADPFTNITPVHILDAQTTLHDDTEAVVARMHATVREHRESRRTALTRLGLLPAIAAAEKEAAPGLPEELHQRIAAINAQCGGHCVAYLRDLSQTLSGVAEAAR
eukprot:RCo041432